MTVSGLGAALQLRDRALLRYDTVKRLQGGGVSAVDGRAAASVRFQLSDDAFPDVGVRPTFAKSACSSESPQVWQDVVTGHTVLGDQLVVRPLRTDNRS